MRSLIAGPGVTYAKGNFVDGTINNLAMGCLFDKAARVIARKDVPFVSDHNAACRPIFRVCGCWPMKRPITVAPECSSEGRRTTRAIAAKSEPWAPLPTK